jgi:predicted PurR-regulated permease PerM
MTFRLLATTGSSSVAVAVAVIATLIVVALLLALVSMIRAATELRKAAERLTGEVTGLLDQLDGALATATIELERVDDLVGSAANLTETVSVVSRSAYVTLASPVIRIMALRRGAARARNRWRDRRRVSTRR